MRAIILEGAIDVFIVVMLTWMIFYDSEPANPIRRHWIPRLEGLFVWLGLNAEWRMFSPDPPQRTIWPQLRMTLKNGEVVDWEPTRYDRLTVWQKIKYKKFLKLYREVARPGTTYQTKRNFIEYQLRRKLLPAPCQKVEIYMVFEPAPPFGKPAAQPARTYKRLVYTFHPAEETQS